MSVTVAQHFGKSEAHVRDIYAALLACAQRLGPVREDPKKTSIHLVRETAFAGVAVQKAALVLTLKSDRELKHRRIRNAERASAKRWHMEIRLEKPADVDRTIERWLRAAYALSS